MKKNIIINYIILIIIIHSAAFLLFFRFEFFLDGYPYVFWGHSIFFSGDIQMNTQYSMMPGSLGVNQLNDSGYGNNVFPMGHSLVYMPMFANSCIAEKIAVLSDSQKENTGYSQTTYFNYLVLTFFICLFSNILLFLVLKQSFSPNSSFFASVFMFFGSAIFGYSYLITSFSHMTAFFFSLLLVYVFIRRDLELSTRFYLYSAISSLLIIIRYDALIYLLIPFYDFLRLKAYKHPKTLLICLIITFAVLSPQLLSCYILNGSFAPSSGENISELIQGVSRNFIVFFTHPSCGAFTLTPLLILAFAGFFAGIRSIKHAYLFLLIVILEYLQITLRIDMVSGTIYGMRRFFSSLIFLSMGLAWLYDYAVKKRKKSCISVSVIVLSSLLCLYYLSGITLIESGLVNSSTPFSLLRFLKPSLDGLIILLNRGFLSKLFGIYLLKENIIGFLASIIGIAVILAISYLFCSSCRKKIAAKSMLLLFILYLLSINTVIIISHSKQKNFLITPVDESRYKPKEDNTSNSKEKSKMTKTPFDEFIREKRNIISLTGFDKYWGERYRFGRIINRAKFTKEIVHNDVPADALALVFTLKSTKRDLEKNHYLLSKTIRDMAFFINGKGAEFSDYGSITILSDIRTDMVELRHKLLFRFSEPFFCNTLTIEPPDMPVTEIKLTGISLSQ